MDFLTIFFILLFLGFVLTTAQLVTCIYLFFKLKKMNAEYKMVSSKLQHSERLLSSYIDTLNK